MTRPRLRQVKHNPPAQEQTRRLKRNVSATQPDNIRAHRWWTLQELRDTPETVYPLGLLDLITEVLAKGVPERPIVLRWHGPHASSEIRVTHPAVARPGTHAAVALPVPPPASALS